MLRELEFRGSNSVCGRTIQKDNTPTDQDQLFDELHPNLTTLSKQLAPKTKKKPERKSVQVLDVAESARVGADVFIPFIKRLHPWTTIKVSKLDNIFPIIYFNIWGELWHNLKKKPDYHRLSVDFW